MCAYHCARLPYTTQHGAVPIVFTLDNYHSSGAVYFRGGVLWLNRNLSDVLTAYRYISCRVLCIYQNLLLSDTSSDEDDDDAELSLTDAEVKAMLREHVRHKRYQRQFAADKEVSCHTLLALMLSMSVHQLSGIP